MLCEELAQFQPFVDQDAATAAMSRLDEGVVDLDSLGFDPGVVSDDPEHVATAEELRQALTDTLAVLDTIIAGFTIDYTSLPFTARPLVGEPEIDPGFEVVYQALADTVAAMNASVDYSKQDVKDAATQNLNPLQRAIKVLADIFIPILPAIVTAGLLMGLNNILTGPGIFFDKVAWKDKSIVFDTRGVLKKIHLGHAISRYPCRSGRICCGEVKNIERDTSRCEYPRSKNQNYQDKKSVFILHKVEP